MVGRLRSFGISIAVLLLEEQQIQNGVFFQPLRPLLQPMGGGGMVDVTARGSEGI